MIPLKSAIRGSDDGHAPSLRDQQVGAFPWMLCALLVGVYLVVRLPNLRELPVFCDEATYLRWAQLIAQDPWGNLFISMEDAKLPLHYWLLAIARPWSGDPVVAGRLLSVVFGALTLPAIMAVCVEMCRLSSARRSVWVVAGMAGLFFIFSPLIAFYQRLALAESLLILESCEMAWLGLRLARHVAEEVAGRSRWVDAVLVGICWLCLLLTKQNFSYVLWLLPLAAMAVRLTRRGWRKQLLTFCGHYAVSTGIGVACFIPILFTSSTYDLRTRLFYKPVFTSNTVYHSRLEMIWQNLVSLCSPRSGSVASWWPHDAAAPLEQGLLYLYLTPPVFVLVISGVIWAIKRRMPREAWFMAAWTAVLLGTVLVGANVMYSRYIVAGVVVLVVWAAWTWADLLMSRRVFTGRLLTAVAVLLLLGWPAAATVTGVLNCRAPIHTREDRAQYLAEGACGDAAERAVAWLRQDAKHGKIVVITGDGLGVQDDLAWLLLRDEPNVQIFCRREWPRLQGIAGRVNTFQLKREQWVPGEHEGIGLAPAAAIYVLAPGAVDRQSGKIEYGRLGSREVSAELVRAFVNPPIADETRPTHGVAVYRLKPALAEASVEPIGPPLPLIDDQP